MDFNPDLSGVMFDQEGRDARLAGRPVGLGEALGANVAEGFWNTLAGQGAARARERFGELQEPEPITREQWEAEFRRDGLSYEEGMTRGRARAMADTRDRVMARRIIMENRDPGLIEQGLGLGAQVVGSIPTPENFIPLAGPTARALAMVGAGQAARQLMERTVSAAAMRGGVEGVLGNALVAPMLYSMQERYGEDVSWGRFIGDLAAGAIVGGAFGGAGGLIGRYVDQRQAAALVDAAAMDVAAGRQPAVAPERVIAVAEDAAIRAAPESAATMLRPEGEVGRRLDLPMRPDGAPLSREEFAAEWARRVTGEADGERALAMIRAQERQQAAREAEESRGGLSLVNWLVRTGGVRDDGGDVRAIMGGARRPGLVNQNGRSLDEAVRAAREAGFFDDLAAPMNARMEGSAPDPLAPRDLIDAIEAELKGVGRRRAGISGMGAAPESRDAIAARLEGQRNADIDEAFRWYEDAAAQMDRMRRLSQDDYDTVMERAAIMEADGGLGREEAMARAIRELPDSAGRGAGEDVDADWVNSQIEALRAEGRLTDADDMMLRAGVEAAADLEARANGLEAAGACLLRNIA